jgi:hypothetical protein
MANRLTFMLLLAVAMGHVMAAQELSITMIGPPHGELFVAGAADGGQVIGGPIGLIAVEPFETGRPVAGAPYSAEAVTEVTQLLHDGNRIENRTSVTVARDSQGRVRREQRAVVVGPLVAQAPEPIITITDPSSGVFITLDAERKVAIRTPRPPDGQFRTMGGSVRGGVGAGVGVGVGVGGGGEPPPLPPPPLRAQPVSQGETRTESLGTMDIEGVRAEGTRVTVTIPAGAIGNQLPIAVVTERWYSRELQVVVQTRRSDPRTGETVYRLTNVSRAEPPPDLFQIPTDYRIQEPQTTIRNR